MEPTLYIVMREDLWDMNPGKGMAQAAHAQADFDQCVEDTYPADSEFRSAHIQWCQDRNFGKTIVLKATRDQMNTISYNVAHAGITEDPTYPYRNYYGEVFTCNTVTSMWVFAIDEEDISYMKQFDLHY